MFDSRLNGMPVSRVSVSRKRSRARFKRGSVNPEKVTANRPSIRNSPCPGVALAGKGIIGKGSEAEVCICAKAETEPKSNVNEYKRMDQRADFKTRISTKGTIRPEPGEYLSLNFHDSVTRPPACAIYTNNLDECSGWAEARVAPGCKLCLPRNFDSIQTYMVCACPSRSCCCRSNIFDGCLF